MTTLLLVESLVVVIAAPIVGVAATSRRQRLAAAAALLCGAAAWVVSAAALDFGAPVANLQAQVTLAAAALALGSAGAFCASLFRHPLDAAACGVAAALVAGFAAIAAGPLAGDLPLPVLNLALTASPVVAAASAASIDMFRGELLYHLSPIAHRSFDYPAWHASAGLYAACAALLLAARAARVRWGGPVADYRRFCS